MSAAPRRAFVTGATGVLGGALVRQLLERGDHVVLLVRDEVRGNALARDGLLAECDLVHGDLLERFHRGQRDELQRERGKDQPADAEAQRAMRGSKKFAPDAHRQGHDDRPEAQDQ